MNRQPLQDDDDQNSPNDSENLANLQKLLDGMKEQKPPLYWATKISLQYGIRGEELIALKKENYDRFKKIIRLSRSMSGRSISIPIKDQELIGYFENLPFDCKWLFPWFNADGTYRQLTFIDINKY